MYLPSTFILEQAVCIAATKLAWMGVILNGTEASGSLTMVGHLKSIARQCIRKYKLGVRSNPLPMGLYTLSKGNYINSYGCQNLKVSDLDHNM